MQIGCKKVGWKVRNCAHLGAIGKLKARGTASHYLIIENFASCYDFVRFFTKLNSEKSTRFEPVFGNFRLGHVQYSRADEMTT